jgi:hypothetical protein
MDISVLEDLENTGGTFLVYMVTSARNIFYD